MRNISIPRIAILLSPTLAVTLLAFYAGYLVGLRSQPVPEATLLDELQAVIDPDTWLEDGGMSSIDPYPSNLTACTPEDILGSREAYERMFDLPTEHNSSLEDSFKTNADDDPFGTTVKSRELEGNTRRRR